jgi:hypothetical protein
LVFLSGPKAATTAAEYNAAAMEQQLKYYNQQKIYQQVVAPFDGVITHTQQAREFGT